VKLVGFVGDIRKHLGVILNLLERIAHRGRLGRPEFGFILNNWVALSFVVGCHARRLLVTFSILFVLAI
jgi:hypothetical protein